jgi:hypothetical protein
MPAPSFENNILPLFRPMDIQCMRGLEPPKGPVLLANYEYMSKKENGDFANAKNVLAFLKGDKNPRMPYGGPYWSNDNIQLFQDWIAAGCPK